MDNTKSIKVRGLTAYELAFREHVRSFIKSHKLIDPNKKTIVSVSGGVDSIVLAHVLHKLNFQIELLHFNHGTRPVENSKEENFIKKFASSIESHLMIRKFEMNLEQSNFENTSRDLRKKIHKEFINKNYQVLTAHHIDDSFEWSLMQSFKQSNVSTSLGIPVVSAGIIRPFMCVSKEQIRKYARAAQLEWMEDSSNENEKFERNFLRLNLSHVIQKKYPSALKHYVSRSNQMAYMLNQHRLGSASQLQITKEDSGGMVFVSESLKEHKQILKKYIHDFSSKSRGEIDGELNKFLEAFDQIQKDKKLYPFKGPLNLSGGVELFLIRNTVLLINKTQLEFYRKFDHEMRDYLQKITQIPERLFMVSFPGLVVSFRKRLKKPSKVSHPLLPVTCEWLKNAGISYTFTPIMDLEDRQMLAFDAVILDSSVMGL